MTNEHHESDKFQSALDWVLAEHQAYESKKFDRPADDLKVADDWEERITMYLHRAKTLGLDNPLGRQAVGKAATTAVAYLESVMRAHESVPAPGFPSGEIRGEFRG